MKVMRGDFNVKVEDERYGEFIRLYGFCIRQEGGNLLNIFCFMDVKIYLSEDISLDHNKVVGTFITRLRKG